MDVAIDCPDQFPSVCESVQVIHFRFQHTPETFHWAIVDTPANSGHALAHLRCLEFIVKRLTGILKTSVAVKQRMCARIVEDSFIKGIKDKSVIVTVTDFVCYDPLVVQIKDCAQI